MAYEQSLGITASAVNKTYIGASFCGDEAFLRDVYTGWGAGDCIDFNAAREVVQQGGDPIEAAVDFCSDMKLSTPAGAAVRSCLRNIAAGNCSRYPRE